MRKKRNIKSEEPDKKYRQGIEGLISVIES